jgi:hypothetical protein
MFLMKKNRKIVKFAVICMGSSPRQFYFPLCIRHKINRIKLKKFAVYFHRSVGEEICSERHKSEVCDDRKPRPSWSVRTIPGSRLEAFPQSRISLVGVEVTPWWRRPTNTVWTPLRHTKLLLSLGRTCYSRHPDFRSERRRGAV